MKKNAKNNEVLKGKQGKVFSRIKKNDNDVNNTIYLKLNETDQEGEKLINHIIDSKNKTPFKDQIPTIRKNIRLFEEMNSINKRKKSEYSLFQIMMENCLNALGYFAKEPVESDNANNFDKLKNEYTVIMRNIQILITVKKIDPFLNTIIGYNGLHVAAFTGSIKLAKKIVEHDELQIRMKRERELKQKGVVKNGSIDIPSVSSNEKAIAKQITQKKVLRSTDAEHYCALHLAGRNYYWNGTEGESNYKELIGFLSNVNPSSWIRMDSHGRFPSNFYLSE